MNELTGYTAKGYEIEKVIGRSAVSALVVALPTGGDDPCLLHLFEIPLSYEKYKRELYWAREALPPLPRDDIARIVAVEGTEEDGLFFRLPYVEGLTLDEYMRGFRAAGRSVSPETAVSLVRQIAVALAAALRFGVVHKYLHPHHVIVGPNEQPVIIGLDMPPRIAEELIAASGSKSALYLSPEQQQGLAPDVRHNIYTLGVFLYELLAGELPNLPSSPAEQVLPPLEEVRPGLEPEIYSVVRTCLKPQSWARYQTYNALLEALGQEREVKPGAAGRQPEPVAKVAERRGSGWQLALISLVLVALIALGRLALAGGTVVPQASAERVLETLLTVEEQATETAVPLAPTSTPVPSTMGTRRAVATPTLDSRVPAAVVEPTATKSLLSATIGPVVAADTPTLRPTATATLLLKQTATVTATQVVLPTFTATVPPPSPTATELPAPTPTPTPPPPPPPTQPPPPPEPPPPTATEPPPPTPTPPLVGPTATPPIRGG